ncbi:hypothetical protein [Halomonas stenophila]|uniref:Uncharacterized protein n=1 Tax=Halomonas stenophila TaxID=795312 RepID=A0A7W5EUT4_9GAMM|nr:hypothetical protein [Halomonas stenophila]MBB3231151.1 hypothetical protein [Halomonas stenophila]
MSPLTPGPSHREDSHLKDRLNQIAEKITSPAFLSGQGLSNEIGFWIFDYPPEHELQVREYLTFVEGVLSRQHSELTVDHVNLLRDYLHERGFLDKAITRDGHTLQVDIYRLEEEDDWLLEVVNKGGTSHVWDDRFATDQAAMDAVHEAIDEEGIAAFLD